MVSVIAVFSDTVESAYENGTTVNINKSNVQIIINLFFIESLLSATIYLWLISLTVSKELPILLLKLLE